jgi:electron transfer flavoprotein beta subunit
MKNIIVCVKQVPNTSNVRLDPKHHTLIREGIDNILNPHDETAIGAALNCKNRYGVKVGAATMGPPQAKEVLIECLKMGVDEAFLLTDERLAGSDTLATSMALSSLIRKVGYENVFCGQESIDSSTGHIGPSIAEFLDLPQVTHADEIVKIYDDIMQIRVDRGTVYEIMEVKLPVSITFNKSIKKIGYKIKEVDEKKITKYNLDDLSLKKSKVGIHGSPTWVVDVDIDESVLNFLRIDSNLSAEERMRLIFTGGIVEKEDRIILKGSSKKVVDTLLQTIKSFSK